MITHGHAGASKKTTADAKKLGLAKEPHISFSWICHMAAHATIEVLQDLGCACAIFSSFACKLYDNNQIPNVGPFYLSPNLHHRNWCCINLIEHQHPGASTPQSALTQEDIKEAIIAANPDCFILKAAHNPTATYCVLYYSVSTSTAPPPPSKVDILLPGMMHLPSLPALLITWKNELPLVPFSVLILQKLQGWNNHQNAVEDKYIKKAPVGAQDLGCLIGGSGRNVAVLREVKQTRPWSDRIIFSEEFKCLS
jgi:hypothetical protein